MSDRILIIEKQNKTIAIDFNRIKAVSVKMVDKGYHKPIEWEIKYEIENHNNHIITVPCETPISVTANEAGNPYFFVNLEKYKEDKDEKDIKEYEEYQSELKRVLVIAYNGKHVLDVDKNSVAVDCEPVIDVYAFEKMLSLPRKEIFGRRITDNRK